MSDLRDDHVTTTIHLSGPAVEFNGRVRQRCAWCGFVICDDDLTRMAFSVDPCRICGATYSAETVDAVCLRAVEPGGRHAFRMPDPPKGFAEGAFLEIVVDPGGFRATSVVEAEPSADGVDGHVKVPGDCCLWLPAELTGTEER